MLGTIYYQHITRVCWKVNGMLGNETQHFRRRCKCEPNGSTIKYASGLDKGRFETTGGRAVYLELVYLVTALVPSLTACLANSPGSSSLTAVWISRDVMVERLL